MARDVDSIRRRSFERESERTTTRRRLTSAKRRAETRCKECRQHRVRAASHRILRNAVPRRKVCALSAMGSDAFPRRKTLLRLDRWRGLFKKSEKEKKSKKGKQNTQIEFPSNETKIDNQNKIKFHKKHKKIKFHKKPTPARTQTHKKRHSYID